MTARESERDYIRRMERRWRDPATRGIATADLCFEHFPPARAGWDAISALALTLPEAAYDVKGDFDRLAAVVAAIGKGTSYADALPAALDDLRIILHAHQRRIRWLEREEPDLKLCRAIIRRMRLLVAVLQPPRP